VRHEKVVEMFHVISEKFFVSTRDRISYMFMHLVEKFFENPHGHRITLLFLWKKLLDLNIPP